MRLPFWDTVTAHQSLLGRDTERCVSGSIAFVSATAFNDLKNMPPA